MVDIIKAKEYFYVLIDTEKLQLYWNTSKW